MGLDLDLVEPPSSLDFFLRDFLGISAGTCWEQVVVLVVVVKSCGGGPSLCLLDCLGFDDGSFFFGEEDDSSSLFVFMEWRLDDFGNSSLFDDPVALRLLLFESTCYITYLIN